MFLLPVYFLFVLCWIKKGIRSKRFSDGKNEITKIVKKKLDGETKVLDGAVIPYYYGWSF